MRTGYETVINLRSQGWENGAQSVEKLNNAVSKTDKAVKKSRLSLQKYKDIMMSISSTIHVVGAVWNGIKNVFSSIVEPIAESARQVRALTETFVMNGSTAYQSIEKLNLLMRAVNFQAPIEQMANLFSKFAYLDLTNEQLAEFGRIGTAVAKTTRLDINIITQYISKMVQMGEVQKRAAAALGLNKEASEILGMRLKEATSDEERLIIVQDALNEKFGTTSIAIGGIDDTMVALTNAGENLKVVFFEALMEELGGENGINALMANFGDYMENTLIPMVRGAAIVLVDFIESWKKILNVLRYLPTFFVPNAVLAGLDNFADHLIEVGRASENTRSALDEENEEMQEMLRIQARENALFQQEDANERRRHSNISRSNELLREQEEIRRREEQNLINIKLKSQAFYLEEIRLQEEQIQAETEARRVREEANKNEIEKLQLFQEYMTQQREERLRDREAMLTNLGISREMINEVWGEETTQQIINGNQVIIDSFVSQTEMLYNFRSASISTMKDFTREFGKGIMSVVKGEKSFSAAMKAMTGTFLASLGEKAMFAGIEQLLQAIASAASLNFASAGLHLAAGIGLVGLGAALGFAGGKMVQSQATAEMSKSSSKSSSYANTESRSTSSGLGSKQLEENTYIININSPFTTRETEEQIFNAVSNAASRKGMNFA